MCYETDSESDEISVTSFSITCCTEQTEIAYRTAEHYSYVNTAAVTSDHNPHCTLTTILTVHSQLLHPATILTVHSPQSSLYTHSSSYDGRQCGDYRYCIL